jgi:hypothetical protein
VVERFPPLAHDIKLIEALVDQVWKLQETYGNYFTQWQRLARRDAESVRERDEKLRTMEEAWQRQRRNAELFASQGQQRRTAGIITGEAPGNGQDKVRE